MKLQQKVMQALQSTSQTLRRFPLTSTFVLLSSLCVLFLQLSEPSTVQRTVGYVLYSALLGAVCALCSELFCERRPSAGKAVSIRFRILSVALAGVTLALQFLSFRDTVQLAMLGCGAALGSLAVYVLIRKDPYAENAAHSMRSLFVAGLTLGVLMVGMLVCVVAFAELVWDDFSMWQCVRVLLTLTTTLAVFIFLSGLPEKNAQGNRPDGIYRGVLVYAELPLYFVLLGVLYLYLIKILCMGRLPDGGINGYAVAAEGVYLFNLFAVSAFAPEKPLPRFFRRFGGLLLLPVLAMQTAAVGVRIAYYGLTTPRMVLILFMLSILAFVVGSCTRIGLDKPLLLVAALAFIFTVTPLNITNIPLWQQSATLRNRLVESGMLKDGQIHPNTSLTDVEKRRLTGSFDYLTSRTDTPEWLQNAYDPSRPFSDIFGFEREIGEAVYANEYRHYSFSGLGETTEDIARYSSLSLFGGDIVRDGDAYRFENKTGVPVECDVAPFVEKALALIAENTEVTWCSFDEPCVLSLDENTDYRLISLHIERNETQNEILVISFEGYLLSAKRTYPLPSDER